MSKKKLGKILVMAYMAYSVTADLLLLGGIVWLILS